jgi:hypothetical protein
VVVEQAAKTNEGDSLGQLDAFLVGEIVRAGCIVKQDCEAGVARTLRRFVAD